MVHKKTFILFISLFSLLLVFGIGHHHLICFGVKSYLGIRLPKGGPVEFSYKGSDWDEGQFILRDVALKRREGKGSPGFNIEMEDLKVAFDFQLFPFKLFPKIVMDHPHIFLMSGEYKGGKKKKGTYELLNKYFFKVPVKIKEGEVTCGDQVAAITFINPEGGKKGLLKIGKKGEKAALIATFSKGHQDLQFDLSFEDLDVMWAFEVGRFFLPQIKDQLVVDKGTLKGTFSLSYLPPYRVDYIKYDLNLSDFALHHERYGLSVGIHHLSWNEHSHSKEEIGQSESHPFFERVWPYLVGDGEIVGVQVSIKDPYSNQEWNFADVNGNLRFSQLNAPLIEFHGNYHGENEEASFHLVGEGKIENETFWKMAFDSQIFSKDEVRSYFAITSKGNRQFFIETDCQNLSPHQLSLFKHFASASLPILDKLYIEGGSFNGKGSGWIEEKKLTWLEFSSMQASNVQMRLPSENLQWQAKDIAGRGEFDLSTPDFYDGTYWEVSISDGNITYGEKGTLEKVNLFLAMHDQYVKSSTLECEYQGAQGKVIFEGLYTHLNINIDALVSSENLADLLNIKKYKGFSDPLAVDLDLKLKTVDNHLGVDGILAFIREKEKSDAIEFGWTWDLKKLKEKKFQKALELGWFKGERISDRTINIPLIFWNKEFRAEGEIGIEGTFNSHAIEFTLDPTHIKYRSNEIDMDPQIKGDEKAPDCIFFYDFNEGFWRGKIPLKGVRLKEHSFGIEFDSFTSEVDLEGTEFLFQNVDAIANDVRFQAEVVVDFSLDDQSELTINTYAIEGEAQGAIAFLNHFEMFKGVNLPLNGKMISGSGDMHLHAYVGGMQELLEWKIALHFKEGSYPFSSTFGFENLAGELYYSADEKRFIVEKVAGTLMLTAGDLPRSYELNVPLLEVDAEEGILIYDCRLEAPTHEICRLVGSGAHASDEFTLTFDRDRTRLYGALIDVKALTFKEGRLNRAQIETHLSALDLVHHLDFLSSAGIIPMKSEALDEMRGPSVEGDLALKLDYDFLGETLLFDAHSKYLSLGPIELDHLAIRGNRKGDHLNLERFEMGALSVLAEMKREHSKWEIPTLEVIWKKSFLKATYGSFNEEAKTFTLPLEGLRIELGEVKNLFPHLEFDWDYLCGTLFATGDIVFDFSKGFQKWFFDSYIKLIGEEFGRAKLRLESSEVLNIAYHPFSGFKIGKANFNFLHPRSNQLWAKCHFDSLKYSKGILGGKVVKMIIPPEMLSFLGQTHSLPHLGYEKERLIVLGYPIKWDNQVEAVFDFSLGEKKEAKGSLKEGYYWIGDKAWYLNDFSFNFENAKLKLNVNTAFDQTPFDICVNLSFFDRFRSRFEIKELTKERQKQPPLVIATDWNQNEGFFIQTIEGGVCGLDFSFHHNPKNSFLDKMALVGQLKINVPRFTKLLPEKMQETVQGFEIGKGYELSGDLVLSKTFIEESQFAGYLKGKNFELMGSVMETLLSEIHIHLNHIELNHFNLSDVSGMFFIETIQLTQNDQEGWELSIPDMTITDFRPSLLKKIGQYPTRIKPLTIRNLHCCNIRGTLGDMKSFTGKGELNFINTFKRDYHILDIPFDILGRLGLDMGLLVPVRGDLEFVLIDGRVYLTNLKGSYSEGKRSQFFLSPVEHSYLDFEGNLNINIKMKQYVLLKVTEPFTLYIGGTFENPKYGLR
ncbi:MAG: hypothetical protein P0S93_05030 [Candidatus Neptunochlamydia sp.]|nr:hypothetical protein [Candidatus Neptunochlamydia sp.]